MRSALNKLLSPDLLGIVLVAVVIFALFPSVFGIFRLNLIGKYLTYAFVAVSLVLLWGYGGVLSLGQGVFFGLGGYCMAMYLKLEASDPVATAIQSTPGIPDFMDWNQLKSLPLFWIPFKSLAFTIFAILAVPTLFAFIVGVAMFKRRVAGTYFAIITQAIALILSVLIVGQQGLTGGINGITDLKTLHGWDIRSDSARYILYFVNAGLLVGCMLIGRYILSTKFGMLLLALRDKEDRVRFSGYDVANFKTLVFCVSAAMCAIGGAMFTLQVGFMSPSFVGIVPSIEMVVYAAVGGRMSIAGAVVGTLAVNFGKTYFSEEYPQLWSFLMGATFIAVVLLFPNGIAGLWQSHGKQLKARFSAWRNKLATGVDAAAPVHVAVGTGGEDA